MAPAAPVNVDPGTGEIIDTEFEEVGETPEAPAPKGRKATGKQAEKIDEIIGG